MENIGILKENKQSLWLDFISRDLIQSGKLEALIKQRGVTGLTSNPSIFEKAISDSNDYDKSIIKLLKSNSKISGAEIFEELTQLAKGGVAKLVDLQKTLLNIK